MSGMRLKDILQELVPSVLVLTIPFLVIWKYGFGGGMDIIFSSTLVNIDDVIGIHPPVSCLGRAPGRLGHLDEASWEVACHNTNLEFELSQYQPGIWILTWNFRAQMRSSFPLSISDY